MTGNNQHPTWGGARQGSGRKKVGNAVLYAKITQEALDKLKAAAAEEGLPVGTYITKALNL